METICRRVLISGRVQGVAFRWHTRAEAVKLGITGWVRNLKDGRVEALFEGDPDAVMRMVNWCRKGPPYGHVEKISVYEEKPSNQFTDFDITHTRGFFA